jgi:hypothetical protein
MFNFFIKHFKFMINMAKLNYYLIRPEYIQLGYGISEEA